MLQLPTINYNINHKMFLPKKTINWEEKVNKLIKKRQEKVNNRLWCDCHETRSFSKIFLDSCKSEFLGMSLGGEKMISRKLY